LKIGGASPPRLEPALGMLLHYGTLLASAVIASAALVLSIILLSFFLGAP
jgi:hypothetical protein